MKKRKKKEKKKTRRTRRERMMKNEKKKKEKGGRRRIKIKQEEKKNYDLWQTNLTTFTCKHQSYHWNGKASRIPQSCHRLLKQLNPHIIGEVMGLYFLELVGIRWQDGQQERVQCLFLQTIQTCISFHHINEVIHL